MSTSLAKIKENFATCSDEDFEILRTAVRKFFNLEDNVTIKLQAWPYTQIMQVTYDNTINHVGVCKTDSSLSNGDKCPCGKCAWTMGLGGIGGNQVTSVIFSEF